MTLQTYLAIVPDSPEEQVLRLVVEIGVATAGGDEGSLLVLDPKANELVFAMTVGGAQSLVGQRVPVSEGITGLAAATREVQIGAPTYRIKQSEERAAGPEAVIAAPMLVQDDLIGVITSVTFRKGKRFTAADAELFGKLAAIAGVVVLQRRKLDGASAPANANTPEARIARSIGALLQSKPDAAGDLEAVVRAVASIAGLRRS